MGITDSTYFTDLLGDLPLDDEAVRPADVLVVAARADDHLRELQQEARPAEGRQLDGREARAVSRVWNEGNWGTMNTLIMINKGWSNMGLF